MDAILIITDILLFVGFVLYGKQIGQEGFKNATLNPDLKAVIPLLILGFFLQQGQ